MAEIGDDVYAQIGDNVLKQMEGSPFGGSAGDALNEFLKKYPEIELEEWKNYSTFGKSFFNFIKANSVFLLLLNKLQYFPV